MEQLIYDGSTDLLGLAASLAPFALAGAILSFLAGGPVGFFCFVSRRAKITRWLVACSLALVLTSAGLALAVWIEVKPFVDFQANRGLADEVLQGCITEYRSSLTFDPHEGKTRVMESFRLQGRFFMFRNDGSPGYHPEPNTLGFINPDHALRMYRLRGMIMRIERLHEACPPAAP